MWEITFELDAVCACVSCVHLQNEPTIPEISLFDQSKDQCLVTMLMVRKNTEENVPIFC